MRILNTLSVTVLVLLISSNANARIGETLQECQARYGSYYRIPACGPVEASCNPPGTFTFKKSHFLIEIKFLNGRACSIHVLDYDTSNGHSERALSRDEVAGFLEENAVDGAWLKGPVNSEGGKTWTSQNNRLAADLDDLGVNMNIESREFLDLEKATLHNNYKNR